MKFTLSLSLGVKSCIPNGARDSSWLSAWETMRFQCQHCTRSAHEGISPVLCFYFDTAARRSSTIMEMLSADLGNDHFAFCLSTAIVSLNQETLRFFSLSHDQDMLFNKAIFRVIKPNWS